MKCQKLIPLLSIGLIATTLSINSSQLVSAKTLDSNLSTVVSKNVVITTNPNPIIIKPNLGPNPGQDPGGSNLDYCKVYPNGITVTCDRYVEGSFTYGTKVYIPHSQVTKLSSYSALYNLLSTIAKVESVGLISGSWKDLANNDRISGYNGVYILIPYAGAYYYSVNAWYPGKW